MNAALLLVLSLVAPAASVHLRGDNETQFGAKFGKALEEAASDCNCKPWTQVYNYHHVKCGAGYEASEFCAKIYTKMKSPFCLNKKAGVTEEQWCYVSSTCDEPGVDTTLTVESYPKWRGGVAVKTCGKSDRITSGLKPEMVNTIASNNGVRIQDMGKFTYKMSSEPWTDVTGAEQTTVATIFSDDTMVLGRKVYKVRETEVNPFEGISKLTRFMKEQPTVLTWAYQCTKNCGY